MNTIVLKYLVVALVSSFGLMAMAQRSEVTLRDGWMFRNGTDVAWQSVRVPHAWAISGPFDMAHDLQRVAVEQG